MYKQIKDIEVQAYCCSNVIGLTAVNDPARVHQDET